MTIKEEGVVLRNSSVILALLCATSFASCSSPSGVSVQSQNVVVVGRTIYAKYSNGWIKLNQALGMNIDFVTITNSGGGAFEIKEEPNDIWWLHCLKTATGNIRVEETFVPPAKEYTVSCTHDGGSGGLTDVSLVRRVSGKTRVEEESQL